MIFFHHIKPYFIILVSICGWQLTSHLAILGQIVVFVTLLRLPPFLVVATVWTDPSVSFKLRLLGSVSVARASGTIIHDHCGNFLL